MPDETSMMISHRDSAFVRVAVCLAALALAACDRPTQPIIGSGFANFDGKEAKNGSISSRVLTNKAGVSVLEVRTGTFDNATNTGTPNGWFEKIKYKVILLDGSKDGKKVFERNVNFKKTMPTVFSEVINVCKKEDQDDPDGDGDDKKPHLPCTLQVDRSYVIAIEANVRGVGIDGTKNDVVRDSADFMTDPEIDLSGTKVEEVMTSSPRTTADVLAATKDSNTTYQTRFTNSSTGAGVLATCEVHVFNSANLDVTPSGLTYRWIPNARPAYNATKPASAASDTTTIKPGEMAICEFRMKLSPVGNYTVKVTANALYPDDYDPSNNTATGTISVIDGGVVLPPSGGFGVNATANDIGFYRVYPPLSPSDYRGDSAQRARIDSLALTLLTSSGLTGTYTLTLRLFTVDSVAPVPATDTRDLAQATWTGNLADLWNVARVASNHCASSDQVGSMSVPLARNNNPLQLLICVTNEANTNNYRFGVSVRWGYQNGESFPPVPAGNNTASYGDYLYFHTDLTFSDFPPEKSGHSHAPVALSVDGDPVVHPNFGPVLRVHRYK